MENKDTKKTGVYLSNFSATAAMVFILVLAFAAGFFAKGYFNFSKQINVPTNGSPTTPTVTVKTPADIFKLLPAILETDHIEGDKNAKIMLVVYSDLQCPYCASFHATIKQFLTKYPDVAFVFRHLPLDFHQFALERAKGAECSAKLGGNDKFWTYIDAVYGFADLNTVDLNTVATQIGLKASDFATCLKSTEFDSKISDMSGGGIQFLSSINDSGSYGTPGAVVINRDKRIAEKLGGAVPLADIEVAYNKVK